MMGNEPNLFMLTFIYFLITSSLTIINATPTIMQQRFEVNQCPLTLQRQDENRTTGKRKLAEVRTVSSDNKRKRVQQVRFDERHNQEYVRHATPEDLKLAWMEAREYAAIRKRLFQILYKVSQVNGDCTMLCPDKDCLLGLESFIRKYAYRTKNGQRAFVRDVCSYYRLQAQLGLQNDSEALQELACALSKGDRMRAVQLAQRKY